MNLDKLRKKNFKEINIELLSYMKEQFNLRIKKVSGKLDKVHLLREVKKNIAKIKTILRENEILKNG